MPATSDDFEKDLLHSLRFGGMDKQHLSELVKVVAGIQQKGFRITKAFPTGIPPVVSGLRVTSLVSSAEFADFINKVVLETPEIVKMGVLTHGIPKPDIFEVNLEIGGLVNERANQIG